MLKGSATPEPETKMSPFADTLSAALESARSYFADAGAVLASEDWTNTFCFGGVGYEETKETHAEIATLKGKATKKWAHVTIYRMSSGRYEMNAYIL